MSAGIPNEVKEKTSKKPGLSLKSPFKKKSDNSPSSSKIESQSEGSSEKAKEPNKSILKKLGVEKKDYTNKNKVAEKFKEFVDKHKDNKSTTTSASPSKAKKDKDQLSFLEFLQLAEFVHADNDDHPISVARKICDSKSHRDHEKRTGKTLSKQLEELSKTLSAPEEKELHGVFQIIANGQSIFPNESFTSMVPGKEERMRKVTEFFDAIVKRQKPAAEEKEDSVSSKAPSDETDDEDSKKELKPSHSQSKKEETLAVQEEYKEKTSAPNPDDNNKQEKKQEEEEEEEEENNHTDQKHTKPKKVKPELSEEEKLSLELLQEKARHYKALREALDKRLSDYEGIVFDEKSTPEQYAGLLEPVKVDGQPEVKNDAKGQEGLALIQQAQQLISDVVKFKHELVQLQAQDSKTNTTLYQEALSEISRELDVFKAYSIKVLDTKPNDKILELGVLYLYKTSSTGVECTVKCLPEHGAIEALSKIKRKEPFKFLIKRLPVSFSETLLTQPLNEAQIKTLLGVVEAAGEAHPLCTNINKMVTAVKTVTERPNPQKKQKAISELRLKSHPNLKPSENKRIKAKLAAEDFKGRTVSADEQQLIDFVRARKDRSNALWQQDTGTEPSSGDTKESKASESTALNFDAITLRLSQKAGDISKKILAKWGTDEPTQAVKQRMETRIEWLRDLHPLGFLKIKKLIENKDVLKHHYLGDIEREFGPRFNVDIEMDQTAGELYDLLVMACEIYKGNIRDGGVTGWGVKKALPSFQPMMAELMKEAILTSFVEHNDTLLKHLNKLRALKAKIKYGTALDQNDHKELEYAAFIMGTYIERLASYLALYEETFGQDEIYRKILSIFERAVINTAALYTEYDKLRKVHTKVNTAAPLVSTETPAVLTEFKWEPADTHLVRLGQYQKFYQAVLKPHHKAGKETAAEGYLGTAIADLKGEKRNRKPEASADKVGASSSSSSLLSKRHVDDSDSESGDDTNYQAALTLAEKLAAEEEKETPGGFDEEETQALQPQPQPRSLRDEWEWWQVAALLGLCILISAVGVAVIATVAPHLLYLPILATVLSYGALGTLGGIAAGTVTVGVVLASLFLLGWIIVNSIRQASQEASQVDYAKLDIELVTNAQRPSVQPSPSPSSRVSVKSQAGESSQSEQPQKTRGWCC